jgi:putative ABC transport system permease protein
MALGRGIEPSDAIFGQDPQPVVVLGHKFWQRHFDGSPDILGKTIQLSHQSYTIVGVAAPRFNLGSVDLYLPLKLTQDSNNSYYVMSRLKPGVTRAQAQVALAPLIAQFAKETPRHFPQSGYRFYVEGLNEQFVQRLGGTIALLFGTVVMLLLIGCGNVSILLLARATARQHEFAVRAAVGANRALASCASCSPSPCCWPSPEPAWACYWPTSHSPQLWPTFREIHLLLKSPSASIFRCCCSAWRLL